MTDRDLTRCASASCVRVTNLEEDGLVQVRDSTLGDDSPAITYSYEEWSELLRIVKYTNYLPRDITLCDGTWSWGPLDFTDDEMTAFYGAVEAGDFDV